MIDQEILLSCHKDFVEELILVCTEDYELPLESQENNFGTERFKHRLNHQVKKCYDSRNEFIDSELLKTFCKCTDMDYEEVMKALKEKNEYYLLHHLLV